MQGLEACAPVEGEGDRGRQWPSELNPSRASSLHLLQIHKDKLSFSYTGRGNHVMDVGAIQTDKPFGEGKMVGYYEVFIRRSGQKGRMAIGLATDQFPLHRQPGWEPESYGYHGEDGRKFSNSSRGEAYGPKFSLGDTVGCGIIFSKREVFFTKNGQFLGTAFSNVHPAFYPTIGLHSHGEEVAINLGSKGFVFNIESFVAEQHARLEQAVSEVNLSFGGTLSLIRKHLAFAGMEKTLRQLNSAIGNAGSADADQLDPSIATIEHRSKVRKLIIEGDISAARSLLVEQGMVTATTHAEVLLAVQEFVEIFKEGDLPKSLVAAKRLLGPLLSSVAVAREDAPLVSEAMALLAFKDSATCPSAYLLQTERRVVVADGVNSALVASAGGPKLSDLELAIRQVDVVQSVSLQQFGGRGVRYAVNPEAESHMAIDLDSRYEAEGCLEEGDGLGVDLDDASEQELVRL